MAKINWTADLYAKLRADYLAPGARVDDIAAAWGVGRGAIQHKVDDLKLRALLSEDEVFLRWSQGAKKARRTEAAQRIANGQFAWTEERVERLRREWMEWGDSAGDVAKRWGVSVQIINNKVQRLRLREELSPSELIRRGKKKAAVVREARCQNKAKRGFAWTNANLQLLRELYLLDRLPSGKIAIRLGCTPDQVSRKVWWLGLNKQRQAAGINYVRVEPVRRAA